MLLAIPELVSVSEIDQLANNMRHQRNEHISYMIVFVEA